MGKDIKDRINEMLNDCIKFEVLEVGYEPTLATDGSAGFDLKVMVTKQYGAQLHRDYVNVMYGTRTKVAIPSGYVGLLFPRSSKGHKNGMILGNTIGVIDSDYRGEIKVSLNLSGYGADQATNMDVNDKDRLVQLVVVPCLTAHTFGKLDETERGDGGYGSTG